MPVKLLDHLAEQARDNPDDLILREAFRGELLDTIQKLKRVCDYMVRRHDDE